jgi:hypothetical protein
MKKATKAIIIGSFVLAGIGAVGVAYRPAGLFNVVSAQATWAELSSR